MEWSQRIRDVTSFKFNSHSTVSLNKDRNMGYRLFSEDLKNTLLNMPEKEIEAINSIAKLKLKHVIDNKIW